jgi:DNA polymerase (family X)
MRQADVNPILVASKRHNRIMDTHPLQQSGDNEHVASCLLEAAQLLEAQGGNPWRANAYRAAAETIRRFEGNVRELFDAGGTAALDALPHIGPGIAGAIAEMLITGNWQQLQRLRDGSGISEDFRQIPGIGAALAKRIRDALDIRTLEELEVVSRDGRLAALTGVGSRRAAAIRAVVSEILDRNRTKYRQAGIHATTEPPVALLLDIDLEYRRKAAAGGLPMIAPRRMNPKHKAWLPVLHATRSGWHFTALFSNTPRAHELGSTSDWVVIYFYDDEHGEGRRTAVTETRGALVGQRVVRGREVESRAYWAEHEARV